MLKVLIKITNMILKILAGVITIAMFLCFDAIMNHVLEGKNLFWAISTCIGRFAIGYYFGIPMYNYILEQLSK